MGLNWAELSRSNYVTKSSADPSFCSISLDAKCNFSRCAVVLVHVVGFAPGPVAAADCSDGGVDLQWNYDLEPKRKRLKEQDFLDNNSQISSIDFLQPRSVSTGLGLSLDNTRVASTGDSALLSLIGDDIDRELQQQDTEIDRFLKLQVCLSLNILILWSCETLISEHLCEFRFLLRFVIWLKEDFKFLIVSFGLVVEWGSLKSY